MGQGTGADVGSVVAAGHQLQPGKLELKIDAVIMDPANPKEADVYFTAAGRPYQYAVHLDPGRFNGGIKKENILTAAVDETQKFLGIVAIHEQGRQVYIATQHMRR